MYLDFIQLKLILISSSFIPMFFYAMSNSQSCDAPKIQLIGCYCNMYSGVHEYFCIKVANNNKQNMVSQIRMSPTIFNSIKLYWKFKF